VPPEGESENGEGKGVRIPAIFMLSAIENPSGSASLDAAKKVGTTSGLKKGRKSGPRFGGSMYCSQWCVEKHKKVRLSCHVG